MKYHLGIEDIEPNNWVAWVFEFPGCYARASTREIAIESAPEAIKELLWRLDKSSISLAGKQQAIESGAHSALEIVVAEEFRGFQDSPDYIVNAFFENDMIPPAESDIEYAQAVFGMNRRELLVLISGLPSTAMDRPIPGEAQQNIRGILQHIGAAEWWYWDRLGLAFPRSERPDDVLELLNVVRDFTLRHLPELIGNTQTAICSSEKWSPRKLLRRAIWHEHVHALQIARYLGDG